MSAIVSKNIPVNTTWWLNKYISLSICEKKPEHISIFPTGVPKDYQISPVNYYQILQHRNDIHKKQGYPRRYNSLPIKQYFLSKR